MFRPSISCFMLGSIWTPCWALTENLDLGLPQLIIFLIFMKLKKFKTNFEKNRGLYRRAVWEVKGSVLQ